MTPPPTGSSGHAGHAGSTAPTASDGSTDLITPRAQGLLVVVLLVTFFLGVAFALAVAGVAPPDVAPQACGAAPV